MASIDIDRARLGELEAAFEVAGGRGVELAEEIDALRLKIRLAGRHFYRTVITVEVLTEGPYNPASLEDVSYDILDGDASGDWSVTTSEEVEASRMATLLVAQGSDPGFLFGEDDGGDEEEG